MTAPSAAPAETLVAVRDLRKAFPGTQALGGVSLQIRPGEIVGIVGENGAGKSTLLKILAGLQQPDSGEILVRGERAAFRSVREATQIGISMVSQEQSLLPNISVAENVFLGNESNFVRFGTIDWPRLREAARQRLHHVGSDVDPRSPTWRLSFSERQTVELARVMALQDRQDGRALIILDEPTSVLTRGEVERLFTIMRDIKRSASLVFVSHRLDEVLEITDRIYVLRDGKVAGDLVTGSTNAAELQRLMVGRELHHQYYRENLQTGAGADTVVKAEHLESRGAFAGVSFEVRSGEVLALCGVVGSGCEAVIRTLAGLRRPSSGRVTLGGAPWTCANPEQASRRGIGYIPSERGREGLIGPLSIAHNVTLARPSLISSLGLLSPRRERSLVLSWIDKLRIRCPGPYVAAASLSGGNQQKVVLAKWLATNVKLLLLDHPTRGIDIGAKEEVYQIIRGLTAQGMGIVLVSDTLEEAIGLSDRLVCMRDGSVTAVLDAPPGAKPRLIDVLSHVV
jgi:ribose transport system ATP-binding protein